MSGGLVVFFAFGVSAALAYKPISKFINDFIEKKRNKIKSDIDEALKLKEDSKNLLNTTIVSGNNLDKEVEDILKKATHDCDIIIENNRKRIENMFEDSVENAVKEMKDLMEKVVYSLKNQSVDLAALALQKLIQESFDSSKSPISTVSRDLRKKLH